MDKKDGLDQFRVIGNGSCKSMTKLDMDSADMETEDNLHLSSSPSMVDNGGFGLRPITPESNKESSELMSCFTSPLTLVSSDMNENDDVDDVTPCTPKDGVFDPFAPGPDSLMLAPRTVKYLQESRNYVERRLNFNSVMTKTDKEHVSKIALDDDDDVLLLEAVYDSLLECIIAKQAEDIIGEIAAVDLSNPDVLMTPPFAPRLTGIADACPVAPLKRVMKKSKCIDVGLCRKLELEF